MCGYCQAAGYDTVVGLLGKRCQSNDFAIHLCLPTGEWGQERWHPCANAVAKRWHSRPFRRDSLTASVSEVLWFHPGGAVSHTLLQVFCEAEKQRPTNKGPCASVQTVSACLMQLLLT